MGGQGQLVEAMTTEPIFLKIKAQEVKPYHYGLWTCIEDGEPFANCICSVKWSEDGKSLWFMLESHNFYKADPEEEIEVVDLSNNKSWSYSRKKTSGWVLPPRPTPRRRERYDHNYKWSPDGPECDRCGFVHEPNLEPLGD